MSGTLGIGLIGAGRIGALHADLIAREVEGVEVVCVCDPVTERASELAGPLGAEVALDAEEVVGRVEVGAVAICSSTDTHADTLEMALVGGKPAFCEKPLSLDLATVDRIAALAESSGLPVQVGFNRRFDPSHRSVRDAVRSGTVGDPHVLRVTSRDPEPPPLEYTRVAGGLFLDMTSHDFDMARFITGSEVTEVFARGSVRVDPAVAELGDLDTALAVLEHENGCMTAIDNSRRATYGYDQRAEVFGSAGMARSENQPLHGGQLFTEKGEAAPVLMAFFLDRYRHSYRLGWESFVAAVTGGAPVEVGVEDARRALMIGIAATRSMREGRPVRVEEVEAL